MAILYEWRRVSRLKGGQIKQGDQADLNERKNVHFLRISAPDLRLLVGRDWNLDQSEVRDRSPPYDKSAALKYNNVYEGIIFY